MGTIKSIIRPGLKLLLILLGALIAHSAQASRVEGNLLGVYSSGNISVAEYLFQSWAHPVSVTLLADVRLELPASLAFLEFSKSGLSPLSLSHFSCEVQPACINGSSYPSGWWDYAGPGIANIIAVKAFRQFSDGTWGSETALFSFTGGMPNLGLWDLSAVCGSYERECGSVDIAAFSVVPEPSSALLLGLGLVGIAARRRG